MGGLNCCENPDKKHQIVIEQIIAEDKLRSKSTPNRTIFRDIDIKKLSYLQNVIKSYLFKNRFHKYFEMLKKLTIEELKFNYVGKEINNLENEIIREKEKSGKILEYEISDYYKNNIGKWLKSKYTFELKALLVDKLHSNDIYEGRWNIEKRFHGYGVLLKTDGSKYQGFWVNGQLVGVGRFFTPLGDFFEGDFVDGVAQGYGIFIHNDGTTYKGEWLNDQPHGFGKEYFSDGSYFEGIFNFGKKLGNGHFRWADGSSYSGSIINEVFEGKGKYNWIDGRTYDGFWKNNQMCGKGLLYYSDGSFYDGEFVNNQRSGLGRYQWSESKYYDGGWLFGKQHGKGLYFKKGTLIEGIWNNGKLQNHKVISQNKIIQEKDYNNKYIPTASSCAESKELLNGVINNETPYTLNITKTRSLKKFNT